MHVCISEVVLDFFVVDFYGCCAANAILMIARPAVILVPLHSL